MKIVGYGSAVVSIVFLWFVVGGKLVSADPMPQSSSLSVVTDSALAPELRTLCNRRIVTPKNNDCSFEQIVRTIKSEVTSCVSCSRRCMGNGRICWKVEIARPFFRVGDFVVTDQGSLVHRSEFKDEFVHNIPVIDVEDLELDEVPLLHSFVQHQPLKFFDRYRVLWRDKTVIELLDLANPQTTLIVWYQSVLTPEVEKRVAQIRHELSGRPKKGGSSVRTSMDLRCEGRVILGVV